MQTIKPTEGQTNPGCHILCWQESDTVEANLAWMTLAETWRNERRGKAQSVPRLPAQLCATWVGNHRENPRMSHTAQHGDQLINQKEIAMFSLFTSIHYSLSLLFDSLCQAVRHTHMINYWTHYYKWFSDSTRCHRTGVSPPRLQRQ